MVADAMREGAGRAAPPVGGKRLLVELGAQADRDSVERRVSQLALMIATCVVMLSLAALAVSVAIYERRIERDYDRTVTGEFEGIADEGGASVRTVFDEVDAQWVVVVIAQPDAGSPPPPGVSAWPEPGGVLLSPALDDTEAGRILVARYGDHKAGVIGPEGLVSDQEPYAIVVSRPGVMVPGENYLLDGFGIPAHADPWANGLTGGAIYQRPLATMLVGLTLGLLLPALVLLGVAARAGSGRRDRRLSVLHALGASPAQIRAVLLGEMLRPVLAGAVVALLAVGATMILGLPLPYVGLQLRAGEIRSSWMLMGAALGLGLVLCLVLALALNRPRLRRGTRPAPRAPKARRWGILLLPVAAVVMARVFTWSLQYEDSWIRIFILYIGLGLVALSVPLSIRAGTHLVAQAMAAFARRGPFPGLLVASRAQLADPASTARLGTGIAIIILLAAHVMVLATLTTPGARAARELQAEAGTSVLELMSLGDGKQSVDALIAVLEEHEASAVAFRSTEDLDRPGLYDLLATCETLEMHGLPCEDVELSAAQLHGGGLDIPARILGASTLSIRVSPDPATAVLSDGAMPFIVADHGQQLPLEVMRTDLAHSVIPTPSISPMLQIWRVGLEDSQDKARWNVLVAAIATAILAIALATASIADSGVISSRSAVIAAWHPSSTTLFALAAGRTLPPLLVAIAAGNGAALITILPFVSAPLEGYFPAAYPYVTIAAPLGTALALVAASVVMQRRSLKAWMPGRAR